VVAAGSAVQVLAFSTPEAPLWRWRIINYAGELVEESRETFPTIAGALEQGSKRLKVMNVVDNSVPASWHRSTRHLRLP
jgi:hypothetical protein